MSKKAVYRLGNIDSEYSAFVVESYVKILTCFELQNAARQPIDNKAFKVCIVDDDEDKFCDIDNWSVGVSAGGWIHKPKADSLATDSLAANNSSSAPFHIIESEGHMGDDQENRKTRSCRELLIKNSLISLFHLICKAIIRVRIC